MRTAGSRARAHPRRKGTDVLQLLATGFLLLGSFGTADGVRTAAAAPAASEDTRPADARQPIERVRERLRARPREERARLERHLEEFERLPAPARARLLERARILRAQEHALAEGQAHEPREDLGPERGSEQWHAQLRERFQNRGQEVRAHLPKPLVRWLEHARPETRRAALERLGQRREPVSLRALRGRRERYGVSPEEIRRLERLPLADRLQALR